jgi:hypothetical protein
LDRRLGGYQYRSGPRIEENNVVSVGIRNPTPRPSSQYPVAIPDALSRLPHTYRTLENLFKYIFGISKHVKILIITD